MSKRSKLSRLKPADRRALVEAAFRLALTRVAVKALPFRWIAWLLDRNMPSAKALTQEQSAEVRRVGWAVARLARTKPLHAVCLGQAITAHSMLKRRGISSVFHLGVAHADAKMTAHAWVTAGDLFVTGESGHEAFTEVSHIGNPA